MGVKKDPKAWWRYAVGRVREEEEEGGRRRRLPGWGELVFLLRTRQRYLVLYQRGRGGGGGGGGGLSAAEHEEMRGMEDRLQVEVRHINPPTHPPTYPSAYSSFSSSSSSFFSCYINPPTDSSSFFLNRTSSSFVCWRKQKQLKKR